MLHGAVHAHRMHDLISVSRLLDAGVKVVLDDVNSHIVLPGGERIHARSENGLFMLDCLVPLCDVKQELMLRRRWGGSASIWCGVQETCGMATILGCSLPKGAYRAYMVTALLYSSVSAVFLVARRLRRVTVKSRPSVQLRMLSLVRSLWARMARTRSRV